MLGASVPPPPTSSRNHHAKQRHSHAEATLAPRDDDGENGDDRHGIYRLPASCAAGDSPLSSRRNRDRKLRNSTGGGGGHISLTNNNGVPIIHTFESSPANETRETRLKMKDRRKMREKRRPPGNPSYGNNTHSTESSNDEEGTEVFPSGGGAAPSKGTPVASTRQTPAEVWQAPATEHGQRRRDGGSCSGTTPPTDGGPTAAVLGHHLPASKKLSPANAVLRQHHHQTGPSVSSAYTAKMAFFRGSKSQSDLDADCEDNTADYDSTSVISASEASALVGGVVSHSSQFFIPAAVDEFDDAHKTLPQQCGSSNFQASVQEIHKAGMRHLSSNDGGGKRRLNSVDRGRAEQSNSVRRVSASSSSGNEDAKAISRKEREEKQAMLDRMQQQTVRISELEKLVTDLSKNLIEADDNIKALRNENDSLKSTRV